MKCEVSRMVESFFFSSILASEKCKIFSDFHIESTSRTLFYEERNHSRAARKSLTFQISTPRKHIERERECCWAALPGCWVWWMLNFRHSLDAFCCAGKDQNGAGKWGKVHPYLPFFSARAFQTFPVLLCALFGICKWMRNWKWKRRKTCWWTQHGNEIYLRAMEMWAQSHNSTLMRNKAAIWWGQREKNWNFRSSQDNREAPEGPV